MSMWYDEAVVSTLNWTVPPTLTLIDVAKPWIVASPEPLTCQSVGASPVLLFSQAMTLVTGAAQGSAALAGAACRPTSTMAAAATTATMPTCRSRRRLGRNHRAWRGAEISFMGAVFQRAAAWAE